MAKANEKFEVAVFTAAYEWCAKPIIDFLDPDGTLIQHRFYNPHTIYLEEENVHVKDLRIFEGLDLKNALIIDNQVYSFALNLENGIPIVPFMGESDDTELLRIMKYIEWIS